MRLIDADKTAEVLTKLLYETALNNSGEASMMCEDIAEHRLKTWVDLVPTEAEPVRRGHWIDHTYKYRYPVGRYECSMCGAAHDMEWDYCPSCGAKMDEEAVQ